MAPPTKAPGSPGIKPTWSPASKQGVGTALSSLSDVWFTLADGIVTEVFHPFVDMACTRDLELLVVAEPDIFIEERALQAEVNYLAEGVPGFHVVATDAQERFRIEKTVITDPNRPVLLVRTGFTALQGEATDYSLFVALCPHLANQGSGNSAWVGDYKGVKMLFAERSGITLALACSTPWKQRSVGYVGRSDGRGELAEYHRLVHCYDRAEDGNIALLGQIDLDACSGEFVLALAFGRDRGEAGFRARAALGQTFATVREHFERLWNDWQRNVFPLAGSDSKFYRTSAAVIRTHESKHFAGGMVAGLSTPWGEAQGDGDLGYHLVWPRDIIETVGALLAMKKHDDARRVLTYFHATQEADGHWPQNMLTNGLAHWDGIQLDETAFVILLVEMARRHGALEQEHLNTFWPMVRKAAAYLVTHGPVTPLDRWEEEAGYFPSTMAVEIPALLIAANIAERQGEPHLSEYLRETADAWYALLDELCYVRDNELARRVGVDGYYVRFAKPTQLEAVEPAFGEVTLKNHASGEGRHAVAEIVSPDALALVRFGLRAADDPRIVNTVRVIDRMLKIDAVQGPTWHRYTDDGYGEHADGSPFDGTGIGRGWPLLTGERAHYELAAGRHEEAERLLAAMERFANAGDLIPEQIWDSADIPERKLFHGRPSGSAMPLVWAHAEYVKLRRSLQDGAVFDMPRETVERYLQRNTESPHACWRFEQPRRHVPYGKLLRIEVRNAARVRWSTDDWQTTHDTSTRDTGLGIHLVDLPTAGLLPETNIHFTFYWSEADRWEGKNFQATVGRNVAQTNRTPTIPGRKSKSSRATRKARSSSGQT